MLQTRSFSKRHAWRNQRHYIEVALRATFAASQGIYQQHSLNFGLGREEINNGMGGLLVFGGRVSGLCGWFYHLYRPRASM